VARAPPQSLRYSDSCLSEARLRRSHASRQRDHPGACGPAHSRSLGPANRRPALRARSSATRSRAPIPGLRLPSKPVRQEHAQAEDLVYLTPSRQPRGRRKNPSDGVHLDRFRHRRRPTWAPPCPWAPPGARLAPRPHPPVASNAYRTSPSARRWARSCAAWTRRCSSLAAERWSTSSIT
jgi:hypothetical protein